MIVHLAALVIIGLHQVGCKKYRNDNNEDYILKLCTGLMSEHPKDRHEESEILYETSIHQKNEVNLFKTETQENLGSAMDNIKRAIKHMLNLNQRRYADKNWVEVGNGVHKTDLVEYPADHLKKNLLKLIALKEKRNQ